jgi:hypothetical protein
VAVLLYCVTLADAAAIKVASGVCNIAVRSVELGQIRAYLGDIADPDGCFGNAEALKNATAQFGQVLRGLLAATTPLPFEFPMLFERQQGLEEFITAHEPVYYEALQRVAGKAQYEIIATWDEERPADAATPVKGAEYLKRREVQMARVAAVDTKLKKVVGDFVLEWRTRQDRRNYRWFALIQRGQREAFLAGLRGAGPSVGVRLRLIGPWPPMEFVKPLTERE